MSTKLFYSTFLALTAFLYSVIASAQILGTLGIYTSGSAVLGALFVMALVTPLLFSGRQFISPQPATNNQSLNRILIGLAVGMLCLLFVLPLTFWPASFIATNRAIHWDAGIYHFPKAIELFRSGTLWDMQVCYAEYPSGYESLLAFALALTGSAQYFGIVHVFILFYLGLALWALAKKLTNLPDGVLLFLLVILFLSGIQKKWNPWWIFYYLIFTVGKNDLFLGASLLAALFFAPGPRDKQNAEGFHHLPALAISSAIAFSIKPTGLILAPVLLYMIALLWKKKDHLLAFLKQIFLAGLILLPSLLWAPRNLIATGHLFAPESTRLQPWSILANLTNPFLLNHIPRNLSFFTVLLVFTLVLAFAFKKHSRTFSAYFLLLFIGFIASPASGFFGSTQQPAQIGWRFGVAFIALGFILLLTILSPLLEKMLQIIEKRTLLLLSVYIFATGVALTLIWLQYGLITYQPDNKIILEDQFRSAVGVDGYYSAYDFIQKNGRGGSVRVDNGLPYYAYDSAFQNRSVCSGEVDYVAVFQVNWYNNLEVTGYRQYVTDADWLKNWELVYEDAYGRVYRIRR